MEKIRVVTTILVGGGNSNMFQIFTPKLGEDFLHLTIIFFRWGWFNHQLVSCVFGSRLPSPRFRDGFPTNPCREPTPPFRCCPVTYGVVLQILNIQAGDLQYAGKGPGFGGVLLLGKATTVPPKSKEKKIPRKMPRLFPLQK